MYREEKKPMQRTWRLVRVGTLGGLQNGGRKANFIHTGLASDKACEETIPTACFPESVTSIFMSPFLKVKWSSVRLVVAIAIQDANAVTEKGWHETQAENLFSNQPILGEPIEVSSNYWIRPPSPTRRHLSQIGVAVNKLLLSRCRYRAFMIFNYFPWSTTCYSSRFQAPGNNLINHYVDRCLTSKF